MDEYACGWFFVSDFVLMPCSSRETGDLWTVFVAKHRMACFWKTSFVFNFVCVNLLICAVIPTIFRNFAPVLIISTKRHGISK